MAGSARRTGYLFSDAMAVTGSPKPCDWTYSPARSGLRDPERGRRGDLRRPDKRPRRPPPPAQRSHDEPESLHKASPRRLAPGARGTRRLPRSGDGPGAISQERPGPGMATRAAQWWRESAAGGLTLGCRFESYRSHSSINGKARVTLCCAGFLLCASMGAG